MLKDELQSQNKPVTLNSERKGVELANESIYSFKLVLIMSVILVTSGLLHLAKLAWDGGEWNGPLSLRKPGLFGVSAGLTVWSIAWLMTQLKPLRSDRTVANLISGSLLIEVGLITWQSWRGTASHFNRETLLDASIEAIMLALIVFATVIIFYLTLRTMLLRQIAASKALAIRGGMILLALSCGLGILTAILGEMNIAAGKSYETWGSAGVLKFPHGVALHAIQLLPLLNWLVQRLQVPHPTRVIASALASQVVFLLYSIRQTLLGQDRFDYDAVGALILLATCLLCVYPTVASATALIRYGQNHFRSRCIPSDH